MKDTFYQPNKSAGWGTLKGRRKGMKEAAKAAEAAKEKAYGGGYKKMNKGGKMGHKNISDMERSCSSKTSMNTMSEKRG
jgi:hypothetical protein